MIKPFRHQVSLQQVGYKLVSLMDFKGRKGEGVARTPASAALWNDSVESRARAYDVSPQTVRNYVQDQGKDVAMRLLEKARGVSMDMLKGVNEVDLSIDWTGVKYYGREVEGLTSGPKGYGWGYATATTKYKGKVLVLAFHQYTKGMKKDEVVRSLMEQATFMRLRIRLLALGAEFYTVEVLRLIS